MSTPIDDRQREADFLAVEEVEKAESKAGDDTSEDDSDSDEEEGVADNRNGKVSVKDLLGRVLKGIQDGDRDLTNSSQLKAFKAGDGHTLASNTGDRGQPTALHIMAAMDKKELPKLDSKMEPLIKHLVEHENDLLSSQDRSGHTPLFLAVEAKKEKMVQWMCDYHSNISAILAIAGTNSEEMNCLHVGIDKRVKFLDLLIDKALPETLAAKDGDGNTPLHLAVEYKKCKKGQLDIIQKIIAKSDMAVQRSTRNGDFNKAGQSPYLHHKENVRKALAKEKEREKKRAREEKEREKSSARVRPDGGDNTDNSTPNRDTAPRSQGPGGPGGPGASSGQATDPSSRPEKRPNTQADSRTKYGGRSQPAVAVSSPAVATAPPLVYKDDMKKSALRVPEPGVVKQAADAKSVTDSGHKSRIDEATLRGVERLLKLHYLRSRSYNSAMEILYGRNTTSDLELYFDLSGHANITQTGLENLLSKLKFEDILQYVAIPRLNVEVNMNAANSKRTRGLGRPPKQDGDGKRDLCYIFDRLRKKGVKTILKVIIDDSAMPAHSDEAIEDALKFMDVEIWDWKRIDLCSEVVCRVASKAREVHLYWSGNNAVLRGWSEEGGLRRLRELKAGLETSVRTKQNVEDFCDRMKKLCPEVDVLKEWPIVHRELMDVNPLMAGEQVEHSTKHEWLQCMKEFRRLLFDAERYSNRGKVDESIEEPIKVALIDDGVDVKDLEFSFIGGRTFCTRDEEHNLNDPYYVSGTGHGTIMAKQIYTLCPRAQFYILRLEDHASEEGSSRQLTAKSAALAIMAAVRKKVHIISMSWTIDPPEDEEERRLLEAAIGEAAKADILMFCSASDKGAKQNATYPSMATTKIFTIGAATASGAADPWVGNLGNINFTFPGTKVEIEGGRSGSDASLREATGSSLATALAAGLAALVLYCVQVRLLLAADQEKAKARRDFQLLKKHDYMMKALKDIGTTEESNHKFIEVWEVFGKKVEEKERYDQERWLELIAEVGMILCRKIG
ncbi:intracellular serine protease [Trichoderma cornu-damae]|uniref:Intracellular serine protease n=1 Tax=Trichoderma cornu-damae TaxID=654480 RepID=A0A9P8TYA6_9HYPO|nr:intracellular serine protease [Trichoderma cornu-damae]